MQHENEMMKSTPDKDREWVAPEFTVLTAGATAGGPNVNSEAIGYHPS